MNSQELSIAVTFLMGHYHGEEWPPAPARLFQALVAGVMTCGYQRYAAEVDPALRWLEKQNPPLIRATEAAERSEYRIAVPNNDMDVVAREWASGRPGDPAALRTMKTIRPKQLPAEGPHVAYIWQVDAAEATAMAGRLQVAARCLHTLGWGIDIAFADVAEWTDNGTVYQSAMYGDLCAVPMEGTLDDLYATYERFTARATGKGVDTHTRPSMLRMQPYRRSDAVYLPAVSFMLMEPDGERTKAVPWEHCVKVAGWMRHAAAESLRGEFDESFIAQYIQGHTNEGGKHRRLSYVPVPSIYDRFGDGAIRRVLIIEPPDAAGDIARLLRLKLNGTMLTDRGGEPTCSLMPPSSGDWTFSQYLTSKEKTTWRSVTPVVLHGFNTDRPGVISVSKTERLLLRAFEMAGYCDSMIEDFAFQSGPWWLGTKHASAITVPDHLNGYPRLHVQVRFRRGTRGPVLAGIGRHYGIGLFAASGK